MNKLKQLNFTHLQLKLTVNVFVPFVRLGRFCDLGSPPAHSSYKCSLDRAVQLIKDWQICALHMKPLTAVVALFLIIVLFSVLCCTTCCTSHKNSFPFPLHSPFFFSSYSSVSCSFLGFWLFSLMVICSLSFFGFFFQSFFPFLCSFLLNTLSLSFLFSSFSLFSFSVLSFSDLNTSTKTCPAIHLFSGSSLLPALFLLLRFLLG